MGSVGFQGCGGLAVRLLTRSDLASMDKFYMGARSLADRVKKCDLKSLYQLRHALTEKLSISHYAQLPEHELQSMREAVEAALLVFEPKPGKCRKRVKKDPVPLDLSQVSEADLFADLERWPRKPYCTNDVASGLRIRPLKQAVTMTHIQCNRPHQCAWIVFDIDRPGAENSWRAAGMLEPTWIAVNEQNGHAHVAYGLRVPVLVSGLGARDAPMRYLASVESMMSDKLTADLGYAGKITKNPAHADWRVLRGPRMTYDLSELAANLPGIEKYRPKRKEIEQVGVGRNVALFDKLRHWAYSAIRQFWGGGLKGWNGWLSMCNSRALVYNADFCTPLGGKEVWHLARSVAKWTWQHTTQQGFSDWQSAQGRKGGKASGAVRRVNSVTEAAPWAIAGVSRATWYRKKAKQSSR